MKIRILHLILLVLLSGFIGYKIGTTDIKLQWKNFRPSVSLQNKKPPLSIKTSVDFSHFWQVWERLESSYYDKKLLDPKKMVNGAISGMISTLEDPYTVYLPPKQNTDFKQGLAGQFEGIGAELGLKDKQIIIVAPLAGSPSLKAGVKPGDEIVKVEDESTEGWTLTQAVDKIRGPKGTDVKITLKRGDKPPFEVTITRDTITVKSVDGWIKEVKDIDAIKIDKLPKNSRIMYLRLSQFGDRTNQEWLSLINTLELERKEKPVEGVIFDLRNNPGGYLTDATFVASEFVKNGVIVTQDKGNGDAINFSVNRRGLLTDIPVIILVNKGSASASEIVAGALRDHKRATLLGETSFGKGTIQQAEDLGGGAGLHVTVAKWLTPNGTWVHGKGLKPDIEVTVDNGDPSHDIQLEKAIEELVK
jgi:carboxyl-terminal processing protease